MDQEEVFRYVIQGEDGEFYGEYKVLSEAQAALEEWQKERNEPSARLAFVKGHYTEEGFDLLLCMEFYEGLMPELIEDGKGFLSLMGAF